MYKIILQGLLFNTGWLLSAIYHNRDSAMLCFLFGLINLFIARQTSKQILLVVIVSIIGILNDTALAYFNVLLFPEYPNQLMTFWLFGLWFLFSSTFSVFLLFLKRLHFIKQGLIGGTFGAFAYWSALQFGTIKTDYNFSNFLLVLFCNWFILLPTFCWLYQEITAASDH